MKQLIIALLLCSFACSKPKPVVYQIGVDPTFFPLNLNEQAINVFAFSNELLEEISTLKKTDLARIGMSWDNLIEGLYLEKSEGIFSAAPPNLINSSKFSFSEPYLKTGPVLIVPKANGKISLNDLGGTTVAIGSSNEELELLKLYPQIDFVFYNTQIEALEGTASGNYSACLIPILPARAYVANLFQNSLMISSGPLTNQALRLLTLKNHNPKLITLFNEGLAELQKSGRYDALMTKWSL